VKFIVFVSHIIYEGVKLGLGVVLGADMVRVVLESNMILRPPI
jgi:hypothetical protein